MDISKIWHQPSPLLPVYVPRNSPSGSFFIAVAYFDVDCDGKYSAFRMTGRINNNGDLERSQFVSFGEKASNVSSSQTSGSSGFSGSSGASGDSGGKSGNSVNVPSSKNYGATGSSGSTKSKKKK